MRALFLALLAGSTPGGTDGLDGVRAALARTPDSPPAVARTELVRRLVALGPGATPALFELVSGQGTEALLGGATVAEDWLCPPDGVGALALEALAKLPPARVVEHLRGVEARGAVERGVRVAEVRVLGALATAQSLEFLLQLVQAFGMELEARSVRDPVREALVAILRADEQAFQRLESLVEPLPLEHQMLLCEALVEAAQPASVELLHSLLGRDVELDLAILPGLVEIQRQFPWRVHFDLLVPIKKRMGAPDPRLRAVSVVALGELRDRTAVPALVARLADEDPMVASSAQWSLTRIAGRSDLASGDEWKEWLQVELRWWKDEGPALVERLRDGEHAGLTETLRTLVQHPLAHAPAAEVLVEALPALTPERQVAVCATLAQISTSEAVPALIEILFDGTPEARQAAWQALRTITGRTLPPEPRIWEEFAFG